VPSLTSPTSYAPIHPHRSGPALRRRPDGETQVVIPSVAFRFFVDVLAAMANGNAVTVARQSTPS